jgi:ureidoacrylate peracid hydrolase
VIDPYNDFISEGGKLWDRVRAVAEANGCVPNMLQVLNAARKAELRVFYAMHHRYRSGDYETWKYVAPVQRAAWRRKTFEYGTWGGEIRAEFEPKPGEIVATEHWCSSGFANTDLDLQLKKHGVHQLIVIGLIAHTCVEATVRFAAELAFSSAVTVTESRFVVGWKAETLGYATAIFRQVNKDEQWKHHDALEFPDGRIVLLTQLGAGQEATVLQLPVQPTTTAEADVQKRVDNVS